MKSIIIYLSLLYCTVGYGQKHKDTAKVFYGIAGVIQDKPSDTLKRYYFHKYLFYMGRMNETNGRTSARFQDSVERYYKLLYPKK